MLLASMLALAIATPAGSPADPTASMQVEDTAVRLRWTAPPGCPDAEAVHSWILALSPALPAASAGADAAATVRATGDGYAVDVEVVLDADAGTVHTSRTLESDACELLARAAAVIIAVGLDPIAVATNLGEAAAKVQKPTTTPVEPEPALTTPRPAVPEDTDATRPRRRVPRLEYGIGVGTGVGGLLLPRSGIGVSLAPFVGTRRIHVQTVAQYWLPRQVALDDSRDVRASLQMATAGVRACPLLSWGRLRLELCAGIDAGAVFGRGRGADLEATSVATDPWAGVVLAPSVRLAVAPRVSVGLALEAVISLYRPRFAIDGIPGDLWTVGAGGLRGLFTVQAHRRREVR